MSGKFLIFVFVLTLNKQTARFVDGSSNDSTLKHKQLSFSIYKPGWSLINDGALEVWFRTGMENAMLVYEDDGGEQGEFFDVFLVGGRIRMRMTVGDCNNEERTVNCSFNDLKWHKLVIRKENENTTLSIDSVAAEPFQCSSQVAPMTALYTGYLVIPEGYPSQSWVSPTSQWESTKSRFQGCIKDIQYTEDGIVTTPQLQTTSGTEHGCSSPCKSLKCRHGGICVDRILTAWCNCEGTGYHGKHCAKVIRKTSTKPPTTTTSSTTEKITSRVKDEIKATPSSKEIEVFKSQRKSLGVYHGVESLAFITITVLGMAMTMCNIV